MEKFRKFEIPRQEPKFKGEPGDYQNPEYFHRIFNPNKLVEIPASERVGWGVNIKTGPHSKFYDLIVIQYGERVVSTVGELNENEGRSLIEISAEIAKDISDRPDTEITFIGWSNSPEEFDRRNPQSVKRIHFHTTGITKQELQAKEVGILDFPKEKRKETKRSMRDPFLRLFCDVMENEVADEVEISQKVFAFEDRESRIDGFPAGFRVELRDGLDTLHHDEFFPALQELHRLLSEKYEKYSKIFVSEEFNDNGRPKLRTKEEIRERIESLLEEEGPSDYAKRFVRKLGSVVKGSEEVPKSDWFIKGTSYTSAIYCDRREGDKWFLVMAPRIVCGTGLLEMMGIMLVRTDSKKFTKEDEEKQRSFREEVSERLLDKYGERAKRGLALNDL